MSEIFDADDDGEERGPSRRARALIITAVVLVVAFIGLTTFASYYTDLLWYHSVGYSGVFTHLLWTKIWLFVLFAVLMAAVVGGNILVAFRLRPLFGLSASESAGLDRYRDAVTPIRTWLLVGISAVLGIFAGTSGAGEWRSYMLWRNGGSFHQKDAYFHKDIGFYVFDLPWLHYLINFVIAVTVLAIIAAAIVHYLYGGIRLQVAARDRLSGPAQAQLSVLVGVFALAKAGDYWLDRYDLVLRSGSRFTGMSYTAKNAILPAKTILMGIALICAILFFVNVWRRTWQLPSVSLGLLVLSAILLGLIWPGIVQQFQVKPSEADKEQSFIGSNIAATRDAYDIADVKPMTYASSGSVSGTATAITSALSTAPLVDPKLVTKAFDQLQQAQGYYSVAPVLDTDHYLINGQDRALVLGARELDQTGINDSNKNWSNLHTVYTHGSGLIAAYANQRNVTDDPSTANCPSGGDCAIRWAQGRQSDENDLQKATGAYQQNIYFGEDSPGYSIVGKATSSSPDVELSLDNDGNPDNTTYTGSGGVGIGSTFRQLMYAIKFGEPNFLLSGRVNAHSKVLYDRTPRERVEKVAPWLTLDDDAYPAVVDGHIEWILDGYTTTDRYPNSQRESFATMIDDSLQTDTGLRTLPTDEINYMRNAVKATVDAYDGTVTIYEWDTTDPILKAWESAFPGVVKPKDTIPSALMEHLRYPEDLFKVQRYQLAQYHVTDPRIWYQGSQRWQVPLDPTSATETHLQPPYRLFVDPDGSGPLGVNWSLTSTLVPYKKQNLAAFVSVNSDAASPDYGKFSVLATNSDNTSGPGLIQNDINNDSTVKQLLLSYAQSSAQPAPGNLLTVPVNGGLIFVQPIYTSNGASVSGYPILQYVAVSYGGHVGIDRTLLGALSNALTSGSTNGPSPSPSPSPTSTSSGPSPSPTVTPTGSVAQQIKTLLQQAQSELDLANAARLRGDLAAYQAGVTKATSLVNQALALAAQRDGGSGTPTGGTSSSTSSPTSSSIQSPSKSPSPTASPTP